MDEISNISENLIPFGDVIGGLLPGLLVGAGGGLLLKVFNDIYKNKDLIAIGKYKQKLIIRGEEIKKMNFRDDIDKLTNEIELNEFRCIENIKKQVKIDTKFIYASGCIINFFENYIIGLLKIYFILLKENHTDFEDYKYYKKFIEISQIRKGDFNKFSTMLTESYKDYLKVIEIVMHDDSKKIIQTVNDFNNKSKSILNNEFNVNKQNQHRNQNQGKKQYPDNKNINNRNKQHYKK